MPFINKKQAFEILDHMEEGKCVASCRQVWLRNIQYALKTKTNPLHLTSTERKRMTAKIRDVKSKKATTRKVAAKYLTRDSPPFPANEHCGETKKGNDGKLYKSVPDKNKVCHWKKVV